MPKKPGRPPTTPAKKVGPEFIGKTPEADAKKEIALRERQGKVLAKFGDGLPYSRDHYVAEIRRGMVRSLETILDVGRRLLVMREHEPHGQWLPLLREIGLGEDHAQRMMAAAARIDSPQLAAPARKLLQSSGAPSKLFDLLTLDDAELEKIAGHETDIDPDDIEQMTVSELRRKLRQTREDFQAREKLVERNAKRIGELEEKVARIPREKPDEKAKAMLLETGAAALAAAQELQHLGNCCDTLIQHLIAASLDPADYQARIEHHLRPLLEQLGETVIILDSSGINGFVDSLRAALPAVPESC